MSGPVPTPFTKLLVANRGEVAMRVLRTTRALGYATVAVYSRADASAPHVRAADESVCIGDASPTQSYLRIDRVVEAARATGADAIHPGYGFLAENADFADACADAGIVFVGPSAAAIRAMGDKAGAKRLMQQAGVPCIPGYLGEDQSPERLLDEAARIGYPVMIKAAAGGGGRGMRLARGPGEFLGLLESARSEARGAFGDDAVLLERAIAAPRHVEIQVVADRHGNAIHLGERDCSVQRRHQKLIEEAPSPAVDAALRARMGAVAVDAARAIGYEGVGTLEFLLDRHGDFHFMEMNTRLQVEHPVTEAITGLDLVALQLRVAAGERLSLTQDQVRAMGHAIEVRLCAEDPDAQFLPQSGRFALWQPDGAVRVEHGLDATGEVPPFYDSMVAKLVAHGEDREDARRRLLHALAGTVALGVRTNQAFLARCLAHPRFAAGEATTAFVGAHLGELLAVDAAQAGEVLALAAALRHAGGGVLAPRFDTPLRLALDGTVHALVLCRSPGDDGRATQVQIGERRFEVELPGDPGRALGYRCNGVGRRAVAVRDGATLHLHVFGRAWQVEDRSLAPVRTHGAGGGDGVLRASMSGRVVALAVAAGDRVEAGQPMATLEAMKMEHVHGAPLAGIVRAVHVAVGDQVGAQRAIAEVVPEAATAAPR